ncbi:MAG TPA: hypothetical protein VEL74_14615 [Thermoanaerobaculia bacterium]|nr:hypothetical protein [Thermoanaerobaculia bacterium]
MADTVDPRGPLEGAETARTYGNDTADDFGDAAADGDSDGETVVEAQDRFQGSQSRYQRVSEDVRRGAERARAEFQRGSERAREEFQRGSVRAREGYRHVAESARVGYDRVRTDAGRLGGEVSVFVREKPAQAVLIAAGVGFLLGMLMRRRDDDYEE